jgi:hypothetical protein
MLKQREAASILENIVGADNFSEDPVIISSYTFLPFATRMAGSKDMFEMVNLSAVIMPGTTEEVQAIVKVCNKYRITFKASSTLMHAWSGSIKEGSIHIDMRRMNKIIKLDEKNMYAVVEPYVSGRELAVEAAKKGLATHIIGAGSQTSVLASATSGWGHGHSAFTTSYSGRNCLGSEWVLPTGEVVRWGLVEDGKAGHPGPGLVGIYRGSHGSFGALGVFTKAAIKLHPWPGPAQLEMTGKNPTPGLKIPQNMKVYFLAYPTPEKLGDATYKIVDAQIAYHIWCLPMFFHVQRWMGNTNDEHYEIWKKLKAAGLTEKNLDQLTVVIGAYSEKELKYKEKVMGDIIKETGAEECLPGFLTEDHMERFFSAQIAVHKPCTEFRTGGGEMTSSWGQILNWDSQMKAKGAIREMQKKYVARGVLTDVASESCWGGPIEQKALGHTEFVNFTNIHDIDLVNQQREFVDETKEFAKREKLLGATGLYVVTAEGDQDASKNLGDYFEYKKKIKNALDPNDVTDSSLYLGASRRWVLP